MTLEAKITSLLSRSSLSPKAISGILDCDISYVYKLYREGLSMRPVSKEPYKVIEEKGKRYAYYKSRAWNYM